MHVGRLDGSTVKLENNNNQAELRGKRKRSASMNEQDKSSIGPWRTQKKQMHDSEMPLLLDAQDWGQMTGRRLQAHTKSSGR